MISTEEVPEYIPETEASITPTPDVVATPPATASKEISKETSKETGKNTSSTNSRDVSEANISKASKICLFRLFLVKDFRTMVRTPLMLVIEICVVAFVGFVFAFLHNQYSGAFERDAISKSHFAIRPVLSASCQLNMNGQSPSPQNLISECLGGPGYNHSNDPKFEDFDYGLSHDNLEDISVAHNNTIIFNAKVSEKSMNQFGREYFMPNVFPPVEVYKAAYYSARAASLHYEWNLDVRQIQYRKDIRLVQTFSYVYLIIPFMISLFSITRTMTEKENNIHAYMIVMGLPRYIYYGSHIFFTTIRIWVFGILGGIFVVMIPKFGIVGFLGCFLYAHYIVYSFIFMTTLVRKPTFAFLLGIVFHLIQYAIYIFLPLTVHTTISTTVLMLFNPVLVFFVIISNGSFVTTYYQPLFYFHNFEFYIPVGPALIALLWHIYAMILLIFYFDYVYPVDSTIKKHPLFFLGCKKRVQASTKIEHMVHVDFPKCHETLSRKAIAGITVQDLMKRWGNDDIAVNGVSFVAIRNQVTVLLGQNGAGKSTLFGCMTGLYRPTSGKISVSTDEGLGFCPQWDPLFPHLTVREHLEFYGMLKTGIRTTTKEVDDIVNILGLEEQVSMNAGYLSHGQKRRLSIGMALVGNSKIVLIDEPTTGMDTAARCSLIGSIRSMQDKRTILLTTHNMDEAEAIADRVLIIAKGEIICSGSTLFLKNEFATGYFLTLVFANITQTNVEANLFAIKTLILVREDCDGAVIQGTIGNQFVIYFPPAAQKVFPAIFGKLEAKKAELNIETFEVKINSLEQVFTKVSEMADPDAATDSGQNVADIIKSIIDERTYITNLPYQVWALFMRRLHYAQRHYILTALPTLLLLCMAFYVFFGSHLYELLNGKPLVNVMDTIHKGPRMKIYYHHPPDKAHEKLILGIRDSLKSNNVEFHNFSNIEECQTLVDQAMTSYPPLALLYYVEERERQPPVLTVISHPVFSTAPLAILVAAVESVHHMNLTEFHSPNPHNLIITTQRLTTDAMSPVTDTPVVLLITTIAMIFVFSIPVFLYVLEEHGVRQLYSTATLTTPVYRISSFIFEFLFALPAFFLLVAICIRCKVYKFSDFPIVLPCYILSTIAFVSQMFCACKMFKAGNNAFTALLVFNTIGLIGVEDFKQIGRYSAVATFLATNVNYIFPTTKFRSMDETLGNAMFENEFNLYDNVELSDNTNNEEDVIKHIKQIKLETRISLYNLYDQIISASVYVVLFCIIVFLKANGCRIWQSCCGKEETSSVEFQHPDIIHEETEIDSALPENYAVCTHHLRKKYLHSRSVAISNLTFGVPHGECFGLLGSNGAGKTTTFNMLAGYITPTSGDSYVNGNKNSSFIFSPPVGYCPQTCVMVEELSIEETFYLFARLSGRWKTHESVNNIIMLLKLDDVRKHHVHRCSGGEKRRVAVGVAILTNPGIIILDEPTAGIDPRTRRRIWELLIALRSNGTSVILSSHSVEECETLCTRIGFLSLGKLRAIGTCQHLKSAFSDQYTLRVMISDEPQIYVRTIDAIKKKFPGSELNDTNRTILSFSIPKNDGREAVPLSRLYATLVSFVEDRNRISKDSIKAYSLVDVSLEDIFITATNAEQQAAGSVGVPQQSMAPPIPTQQQILAAIQQQNMAARQQQILAARQQQILPTTQRQMVITQSSQELTENTMPTQRPSVMASAKATSHKALT